MPSLSFGYKNSSTMGGIYLCTLGPQVEDHCCTETLIVLTKLYNEILVYFKQGYNLAHRATN